MIYLNIKELFEEHKLQLDSLLNETSCERVFYWGEGSLKEMGKDTSRIEVYIPYFVCDLSVGGTSKGILYEPKLDKEQVPIIEQHSDLNDIYCQTNSDATLRKLIKDGRYIILDHNNWLSQKRHLSSLSYNIKSDVLMWIQNQTHYNLLSVMKYFRFIYN